MRRNVYSSSAAGILGAAALILPNASHAQPVSIGLTDGVHVRAPFVSVDVYPHGGVSVRAPFTAVDVGGRPIYAGPQQAIIMRPVVQPPFSTPHALAAMDSESLMRALRIISDRLNSGLNRFDSGVTWQRYLRLPDEFVAASGADTDTRRAAAEKLLQRFRDVAADPRYRKIAQLPAFSAMQDVLIEIISRQDNSASANGDRPEELPPPQRDNLPAYRPNFNNATK